MDVTYVVVGAIAIAVFGVGGWLFFIKSRAPKEEPVYYYRCEGCKRKMRYTAKQAMHKGQCPMCKKMFVFPPTGPAKGKNASAKGRK